MDTMNENDEKNEKNNQSLSDKVYVRLKSDILTTALKPGEPLIETDIAKSLNTSRTPVREAIKKLQAENLVVSYPGRGAQVSEVSLTDLLEAVEVRELLEPYAAREAAARINSETKKLLREPLESLEANPNEPIDLIDRIRFDLHLHDLILQAAGNDTLLAIVQELHMRFRRAYSILGYYEETAMEHLHILEAIISGDEDEAERQMRIHVSSLKKKLIG